MKTTFLVGVSLAFLVSLLFLVPMPAAAQSQTTITINGFLFSKLTAIGTRSEQPIYFLQKFDNSEIQIKPKKPFQDDPVLMPHLGTKVTIVGTVDGNMISYTSVKRCPSSTADCMIQWGKR